MANPQDIEQFYSETEAKVENESASQGAMTMSLQGQPSSDDDYIIITTDAIVTNSEKLDDFVRAKGYLGYKVRIVTEAATADETHYVSGSTADDRANNIRSWLGSTHAPGAMNYVLLAGDPAPSGSVGATSVPMKMCYPFPGYGSCPTDMFFAETGADWDEDNDTYYGEYGEGDKYCDLDVGRIPVYSSSYSSFDAILQKTFDYQSATGDLSWRSKVLIAAAISNFGPQDNNGDGDALDSGDYPTVDWRTFGDDWGEYVKAVASSPFTLYEKSGCYLPTHNPPSYPGTQCNAALSSANFSDAWENHYGYVLWWAHGSSSSASRFVWYHDTPLSPPPDGVNIMGNAYPHSEGAWYTFVSGGPSNNYPSFVIGASCLNAYPESSGNLAYSLLQTGAIGTIMATRHSWYSLGAWAPSKGPSYGDNASYPYHGYQAMGSIAGALNDCRGSFGLGWGAASWMNMLVFNVYGDPSADISSTFTPDSPAFRVKDASGSDVAWIGGLGNIMLESTLVESTSPQASANDEFRVQNSYGQDVAIIDMVTGNMVIAGTKYESQTNLSGASNFIVKDSQSNVVAYIDGSGNLYLKGKAFTGWTF